MESKIDATFDLKERIDNFKDHINNLSMMSIGINQTQKPKLLKNWDRKLRSRNLGSDRAEDLQNPRFLKECKSLEGLK